MYKEVILNKSKILGFVKSKIMKIFRYILFVLLICMFFLCGLDELILEFVLLVVNFGDKDELGEELEELEEFEKIQLVIMVLLQDMQQIRGIIEVFVFGYEMGVFISIDWMDEVVGIKNVFYFFDGKVWNVG